MRSIFVFFCFAFQVFGSACPEWIEALGGPLEASTFAIAVDYDGTMVETDAWLIDVVLPKAVERILKEVPVERHHLFFVWLETLKTHGPAALPEYDEAAWARDSLFPAGDLPESLSNRDSLRPGSSRVLGFWDLVQEVFEEQAGNGIEFVPAFLEFYDSVNQAFGSQVQWVIVTARSDQILRDVAVSLERLGCSPSVSILGGKRTFALYPEESAALKGTQLLRFEAESGLEIRAVVDNDLRVLRQAKSRVRNSVLLLHMLPKGRAAKRLVEASLD